MAGVLGLVAVILYTGILKIWIPPYVVASVAVYRMDGYQRQGKSPFFCFLFVTVSFTFGLTPLYTRIEHYYYMIL